MKRPGQARAGRTLLNSSEPLSTTAISRRQGWAKLIANPACGNAAGPNRKTLRVRMVSMQKLWFCLLSLFVLAGALPASAEGPTGNAGTADVLAAQPEDRIRGKPDAPITILEYASLTCPHCANFAVNVLPKLEKKWIETGKARLIFRDFPLDERALRAAMVTRCASPDRFYPLTDMFFAQAERWVTSSDYRPVLERLTKLGGMSNKDFAACISNQKLEDKVTQSRLTAQQFGVHATPSFFINGEKFDGELTFETFDQMLSKLASKM
jgi:protein-disulfide isomerase